MMARSLVGLIAIVVGRYRCRYEGSGIASMNKGGNFGL